MHCWLRPNLQAHSLLLSLLRPVLRIMVQSDFEALEGLLCQYLLWIHNNDENGNYDDDEFKHNNNYY